MCSCLLLTVHFFAFLWKLATCIICDITNLAGKLASNVHAIGEKRIKGPHTRTRQWISVAVFFPAESFLSTEEK